MPKLKLSLAGFSALLLCFESPLGAEQTSAGMVIVADSRNLTGVAGWWANLFNESHLYFTLLTILLIPLAGAILGTIADALIGRIGINLKSRALREG